MRIPSISIVAQTNAFETELPVHRIEKNPFNENVKYDLINIPQVWKFSKDTYHIELGNK